MISQDRDWIGWITWIIWIICVCVVCIFVMDYVCIMSKVGIIVRKGAVYVDINVYYVLFCYFNGSQWYHVNIYIHGIIILIFFSCSMAADDVYKCIRIG